MKLRPASGFGIVQRVIVRADHVGKRNPSEKSPKYDLDVQVLQREIDDMVDALKQKYPDEEVVNLYKPALKKPLKVGEPIRIASHGGSGRLNSEPPERIAQLLVAAGLFSADSSPEINIHSCNVGQKIGGRNFAQKLGDALLAVTKTNKPFVIRAPGAAYSLTTTTEGTKEMLYGQEELFPDENSLFSELKQLLGLVIKDFSLDDLHTFVTRSIKADTGHVNFREMIVEKIMEGSEDASVKKERLLEHVLDAIKGYDSKEPFLVILPVLMDGTLLKKKSDKRGNLKDAIRKLTAVAFNIKKGKRETVPLRSLSWREGIAKGE